LELSCAFPPAPDVPDHIALAERLGYKRAWVYDVPALGVDPWMTLGAAAGKTSTIGLGIGSITPRLRHPLVTASAIGTLVGLAPGRVSMVFGTGFTARYALGQPQVPWAEVEQYVGDVRALLRGETVEIEGRAAKMIHGPEQQFDLPVDIPVLLAAEGPKGQALAAKIADGVMTVMQPVPGSPWSTVLRFGTVLDEGESFDSPRVRLAAGPGAAIVYHFTYQLGHPMFDDLPGSAGWRHHAEAVPAEHRHLSVHLGHCTYLNPWDEEVVDGKTIQMLTMTGTAAEMRARAEELAAAGCTEVDYQPAGPDRARELTAFAAALRGV
jgi:5,10-methylenetetrahydromethanopterin reductase